MQKCCIALALFTVLSCFGCDLEKRVDRLEADVKDIKAESHKVSATADYDLQAKCSRDAKTWFNENWSRDKDTITLNYQNHYNKSSNKCFIFVEYHYTSFASKTMNVWVNDINIWDVYENSKFVLFMEQHTYYLGTDTPNENKVQECEVFDKKCTSIDQFNNLARPYMSN